MIQRLLLLCIGNICRSPMAEALVRRKLAQAGCVVDVRSAGLGALAGLPAEAHARTLMTQSGLDIGGHRAHQLDMDMVRWADLVLVMDEAQRRRLVARNPAVGGKVFLLGHWSDFDIPDPYQKDLDAFERCRDLIGQGVEEWTTRLAKGRPKAGAKQGRMAC